MSKAVRLIKASAGAGKTHFLTEQYIKLLLEGGEDSYRHILAVTFTNKATEEMKSRVVEELAKLASDPQNKDREKAEVRLTRILHDYSGFSISTIDRFFQVVMRAFAREIGQYASYKVELDSEGAIAQAVDMMVDSLDAATNAELFTWLEEYSFRQIEEGNNWNIRKPLQDMANLFFKEDFKLKLRSSSVGFGDKEAIKNSYDKLSGIVRGVEQNVKDIASAFMAEVHANGIDPFTDFKGRSKSSFNLLTKKWIDGIFEKPSVRMLDSFNGHETPKLRSLVEDALTLYEKEFVRYTSAKVILRNLFLIGIYVDVYANLKQYLADNNMVLLGESTDLLSKIIDGSDTPFVYEKIGTRYDHIMLDESQDTSVLQWENFKPLFIESVSKGWSNLIVGDIKQSIYRWRGSDWRLISEYVKRDLGEDAVDDQSNPLTENWRSGKAIVDFNNELFSSVGEVIASSGEEKVSIGQSIDKLYSGCEQKIPGERKNIPDGRVKIGFLPRDGEKHWKELALEKMVDDIRELISLGYGCEDITVLVRKNDEGTLAANYLIKNGFGVITEESLKIDAAPCVSKVLALLNCYVRPEDPVSRLLVEEMGETVPEFKGGSLFEICEELLCMNSLREGDVPYADAFLDCVMDYQSKFGSSIRGFVDWWNESDAHSICAPKGRNAIRVMTIHKAKGLSLEAVIVPFMEETLGDRNPTVWCDSKDEFADIGIIPIYMESALENSIFKDEYERELLYQYVDSINTAYVAMTRSKSQLSVWCPKPNKPSEFKITSFANLLFAKLCDQLEDDVFVFGKTEPFTPVPDENKVQNDLQQKYISVPIGDRLKITAKGSDYFDQEVSPRMRGIELHDILSQVDMEKDLERACGSNMQSFDYLSGRIASIRQKHWFDGTYSSLNEASIVDGDGNTYRPDRILVDESKGAAYVIDYKFGRPFRKYSDQVRQYCNLIQGMGYSNVEGWLWYVDGNKTEKVI